MKTAIEPTDSDELEVSQEVACAVANKFVAEFLMYRALQSDDATEHLDHAIELLQRIRRTIKD